MTGDPTLRSVLARLLPSALAAADEYGSDPVDWLGSEYVERMADDMLADPALAAAERVLAAADEWDRTDSIRDRRRLSEAVRDFRAYRSAVEAR